MTRKTTKAALAGTMIAGWFLHGCGAPDGGDGTLSSVQDFRPIPLRADVVLVPGDVWISPSPLTAPYTGPAMRPGYTQLFPCWAQGIKISYKVKNASVLVGAPARTDAVQAASVGTSGARPALAAGATQTRTFVVAIPNWQANVAKPFKLTLDSTGTVTETAAGEANNVLNGMIKRYCP